MADIGKILTHPQWARLDRSDGCSGCATHLTDALRASLEYERLKRRHAVLLEALNEIADTYDGGLANNIACDAIFEDERDEREHAARPLGGDQ